MTDIPLYNVLPEFFILYFSFLPLSFSSQCILIIYTDTCLRPFESDMPNLGRWSRVLLKGGGGVWSSTPLFVARASPPALHLSPFLRTRAIQRPALTFELPRVPISCARCCKRRLVPVSSQFAPSAPSSLVVVGVVLLLSWSPGLSCGVLVLVLISQHGPSPS